MNVKTITCVGTMREYIGDSRSFKKAFLASKRKWDLVKGGESVLYPAEEECGFCQVQSNIHEGSFICRGCPVTNACPEEDSSEALRYLRKNKERIYALDDIITNQ